LTVTAAGPDIDIQATLVRDARVCGALVVVIAIEGIGAGTSTIGANIIQGTLVVVVTGCGVVLVFAAGFFVAAIIGADVVVIAVRGQSTDARSLNALVNRGAGVVVVTFNLIVQMDTSQPKVTEVVGAEILVIAIEQASGHTGTSVTVVIHGARNAVIARVIVGAELAASIGEAAIRGALVAIVARQLSAAGTLSQAAEILGRADIAVVAGGLVEQVQATRFRVAGVGGADVVVVTTGQS